PAARENQPSLRRREVEHRLSRSGRVLPNSPGNQHREHAIAAVDRPTNHLAVVRRAGHDRDAILKRIQLRHAALSTDADNLVTTLQRMPHHVLTELARGADDAD